MCRNIYRYYTGCGCELFAHIKKCKLGPRSPLCFYRKNAVVEKEGKICGYHQSVNWRPRLDKSGHPRRRNVINDFYPASWDRARKRDRAADDDSDSDWVPGQPDIDRKTLKKAYARRGRVAIAEIRESIRWGYDYDPYQGRHYEEADFSDSDFVECQGCVNCHPAGILFERATYAEGYHTDHWEDPRNPGYHGGNDNTAEEAAERRDKKQGEKRPRTAEEQCVGLGRRTVAKSRRQREARERARLGDARYEHEQREYNQWKLSGAGIREALLDLQGNDTQWPPPPAPRTQAEIEAEAARLAAADPDWAARFPPVQHELPASRREEGDFDDSDTEVLQAASEKKDKDDDEDDEV